MIRLLHLADVHLGASFSAFGDLAAARRSDVVDAFRRLPELAAAEDAHAVAIAGDLFDGPDPPAEVLVAAREAVRRVVDAGHPVFVIPGNHDAITLHPNPWRESMGGAHVFTEPAFGEPVSVDTAGGPLHVYGIAYDAAREPDPLAGFSRADAPGVHVVLLHGAVRDAPHWATAPGALRLEPESLARLEADYIALGDYHRHRPPAEFDAGGAVPACYVGSFAALDLTEAGPRGYVIAEVEEGRPPAVRLAPSGVTPVADIGDFDVSPYASDAEVADAVAERVPGEAIPVARLVGTPAFPLDADAVRAALVERFGHVGMEDASRYYAAGRLDELAEEDTVIGHVVRIGRRRIDEAADEKARDVAEHALRLALSALEVH
ncbi:MAG: metallophosphoesterase family protein [Gemmatimonadota bacterium]